MRNRKILPLKINQNLLAIVIVVMLIAVIFAVFDFTYEIVKKGVEAVGGTMPPKEIWQNTNANIAMVAVGVAALIIAWVIAVPVLKIGFTVGALFFVGVGLWNLYKTFTGKPSESVLPSDLKIDRK